MTAPKWMRLANDPLHDYSLKTENLTIAIWRDADHRWRVDCHELIVSGVIMKYRDGAHVRLTRDAKKRAIELVASRASWLMKAWRREIKILRQATP